MNTKTGFLVIVLIAGLLASSLSFAQAAAITIPQAESVSAKPKAAAVPPRQKRKSGKRYSKTTLSAFKPLNAQQTQAPAEATEPSATRSSVLLNAEPESDPLRQALPLADESSRTAPFTLNPDDQALLEVDAADPVESELVTDPDALGQESISATDRANDKLKTRPITQGPLRLRVKDKGLRASVQIPLESPKP